MAGTKNDTLIGKNADFSQAGAPNATSGEANGLITDGQMWIGSTALNAGGTHINVGTLTSPLATIGITYNSPNIELEILGSASGISQVGVDSTSGAGTNPVVPDGTGLITHNGAVIAAGNSPVGTVSTAPNVYQTQVQLSQALAAPDASAVGLCNFDSSGFDVDSDGFVSLAGSGAGQTITGDQGGPLPPSAGNWNLLGRSGTKTSGSGATMTIQSPPFSQVGSSATGVLNSGEIVTAAVTRTLPATAGLVDGDLVILTCTTAGALVVTANTGQIIRIGASASTSGGTATSTAIGDSLTLRFDATAIAWRAVSVQGNWITA